MQDFRSLRVWQRAHRVTLGVYEATRAFPTDERFGLTSQMRRAATSVASNIAEGCGRGSDADFARFVQMALGSATELDYQLLLALDLGYLKAETHSPLHDELARTKRMLHRLLQRLQANGQ